MAFLKLFPPEGGDALPTGEVISRLHEEFDIIDTDPTKGQDHVSSMITATLRFSDAIPGKKERIDRLRSIQQASLYISFGDDLGMVAGCCVIPDEELFFGSPDEVDGPARSLVERAALALGYTLFEG